MRLSSIGKGLRESSCSRSRFCEHRTNDHGDDHDKIISCRQRVYVICPHCQRSLCLYHLNEHQSLIRSIFDSLVNQLNEYRYEFTVCLSIPPDRQSIVKNCLEELHNVIIPYVQRTCCENDVKQEDVHRLEIFLEKMRKIVEELNDQKRRNQSDDSTTLTKRSRTD